MSKSRVYAWTVVTLTIVVMATLLSQGWSSRYALPTLLFWILLLIAAEQLPVSLGFETRVTMSFPVLLAIAIVFPPAIAMVIAGIGTIDPREFKRRSQIHRAVFNVAQNMLALGIATLPFHDLPNGDRLQATPIILSALLRLTANLGFVAAAVHFDTGTRFVKIVGALVPRPIAGFATSYALLTVLGAATAFAYQLPYGAWAVAAVLIPLLFARLSILGARAQQELSEKLRKQQEALLEATEKVFEEREQERKRIAEQIHDSSLQMLAAASYGCGNASGLLKASRQEEANVSIEQAGEAVDAAIKQLRSSLVDLRRSSVEEGGLIETIRNFIDQVSTLWGTEVIIEGGIEHEPPIPVALAAFQILQEGLVNALKHAQTPRIIIKIGESESMVHIVVEDEGSGFDTEKEVGSDHVGMRLMKERAARVGGRIELDSQPGTGTRLKAILPGGVAR